MCFNWHFKNFGLKSSVFILCVKNHRTCWAPMTQSASFYSLFTGLYFFIILIRLCRKYFFVFCYQKESKIINKIKKSHCCATRRNKVFFNLVKWKPTAISKKASCYFKLHFIFTWNRKRHFKSIRTNQMQNPFISRQSTHSDDVTRLTYTKRRNKTTVF